MSPRGESETDVLVVGAGVAGLAAAARLLDGGRSVRVVEARQRAGGRIHTLRPEGTSVTVELGAEFVHGDAPRTRRILRDAGASLTSVGKDPWLAEAGRVEAGTRVWRRIERVLARMDPKREPDRSFADFARARGDEIADDVELACAFVEGFHAADPERASERALAGSGAEDARDSHRVTGGYDALVEALRGRVGAERIVLGRAVRRVVWKRGRVELETVGSEDGAAPAPLVARSAIVTVPVGVLAQPEGRGSLRFQPELPGMERALAGLAMGSAVRLSVLAEGDTWPALIAGPSGASQRPSFIHTPGATFNAFWQEQDGRVLVAWAGGTRARRLPVGSDALRERALSELAHATGSSAAAMARAATRAWSHDWQADPWSGGAYAYVVVGGAHASAQLRRPADDTIFLAGEAASPDMIGTVEGALESGESAADAALAALG